MIKYAIDFNIAYIYHLIIFRLGNAKQVRICSTELFYIFAFNAQLLKNTLTNHHNGD